MEKREKKPSRYHCCYEFCNRLSDFGLRPAWRDFGFRPSGFGFQTEGLAVMLRAALTGFRPLQFRVAKTGLAAYARGEFMNDITQVLQVVGNGDGRASEKLLPLVYDELRRMAAVRMARESAGHTLQPTALVHEAWLRLVGDGNRIWQNRAHFFGAASEAMRRILIERARRKSRLKRGSGQSPVSLDELDLAAPMPDDKILLLDEALERLQARDPENARVVILKFFGGLSNQDVAETLGVTERTVRRQWTFAKAWLLRCIREQIES